MSEFLAEARILVRPDTSRFRADLEAQLASVVRRPITIPVVPVVGTAFAGAAAGTAALAAAQTNLAGATSVSSDALAAATTIERQYAGVVDLATVAVQAQAAAQEKAAVTTTAATAAQARSLSQLERGAGASALTLFGLRGATLAASGAFLAGTASVVAFSKAVQSAASLQTELNVFQATAGATADQMTRASEAAKELGRDITLPGVSANDAAVALTELSKAGLSVQDSLDGARGALQLATAAQIDNVQATNLIAGALNAFGLAGTQAVHVADLLTGAAKESQGNISDFGTALGQAAAVSHQFGVSIEDTLTLLTELGQAGISGGRAGTSLRVAFLRLINPTGAAAKELAKLNVQVRDANGNLRPEVFNDIADALSGYSKAQRDAALATIFGSDAIRTAAIVGARGSAAFLKTKAAITEVGLAQEQAAARTKGFQGDVENLKNQMSALGLSVGQVAIGPLSALVKQLAVVAGDAATASEGILKLGQEIKGAGKSLQEAIPFGDTFVSVLGKINKAAKAFSPAFLIPNAFRAASESAKAFGLVADDSTKKTDAYAASIGDVSKALGDLGVNLLQSAADSKIFTQQVTTDTANLLQSAADSRIGINEALQQQRPPTQFPVQRIQNIVQGFNDKQVRDKIAGDNKKLVADLQAEQDFLIKQLQKQGVKNRPALKRALEQELLGVTNELDAIASQSKTAADAALKKAQQATDDAAKAASAREQALLAAQGLARDQRQNRIDAAAQTKTLADDIAQQKKLRALVLEQIKQVRERISLEGGRAAAITALRAILTQVNGKLKDLAKQQQDAAAEQRANVIQSARLDIDFAQIIGDPQKEIAARKRLIAQLQEQQKLVAKGTLAYKDLRNQIAEQNKAIADLTREKQKQNGALGKAEFEFLQAQQGFAANLLGNLIPRGATSGLVGNPVQSALTPVAGAADAQARSGPTAGQGQLTNTILRAILDQLKELNGEQKAPEARRQMSWQSATFDGPGVGWGGG